MRNKTGSMLALAPNNTSGNVKGKAASRLTDYISRGYINPRGY